MGMLKTRAVCAPLRGQCNDLIRSIVKIGTALTPVPYDRKLPQFNVVQSDRLCHHHHGVLFHIDLELIELSIQRHQLGIDRFLRRTAGPLSQTFQTFESRTNLVLGEFQLTPQPI